MYLLKSQIIADLQEDFGFKSDNKKMKVIQRYLSHKLHDSSAKMDSSRDKKKVKMTPSHYQEQKSSTLKIFEGYMKREEK